MSGLPDTHDTSMHAYRQEKAYEKHLIVHLLANC